MSSIELRDMAFFGAGYLLVEIYFEKFNFHHSSVIATPISSY